MLFCFSFRKSFYGENKKKTKTKRKIHRNLTRILNQHQTQQIQQKILVKKFHQRAMDKCHRKITVTLQVIKTPIEFNFNGLHFLLSLCLCDFIEAKSLIRCASRFLFRQHSEKNKTLNDFIFFLSDR